MCLESGLRVLHPQCQGTPPLPLLQVQHQKCLTRAQGEKEIGPSLNDPKSSQSNRSFAFHVEIKVPEFKGERQRIQATLTLV